MANKPSYEELEQRVKELEQAGSGRKWAEKTLRESEGKYRTYIEHANDGISVVHKGKLTFVNSRLAEIMGYKVDELEGKDFLQLFPKSKFNQITGNLKRCLAGEEVPQVYESRILHKDGSEIDVDFNIATIESNDEPAALTIIRDISKRKLAEENLKESEGKYRGFLNNLNDIAYETDDMGNITYANKATEKIIGKSLKDIIGNPFLRLFTKNSQKAAMDIYMRSLSGEDAGIFELDFTNGTVCQFKNSLLKDKDGMITGVSGIGRDITKLKRMEAEIKGTQMQIKAMADSSFEAIFLSEKGICLDQNPAAEKIHIPVKTATCSGNNFTT